MDERPPIKIPCIEVTQLIGTFYIGAIESADLVRISWADVRRIESDEREVEVLSGIQRPLSPRRVKELRKYVTNVDASFPTGVILAIESADAAYNPDTKIMEIRNEEHVAKAIDGQHR